MHIIIDVASMQKKIIPKILMIAPVQKYILQQRERCI